MSPTRRRAAPLVALGVLGACSGSPAPAPAPDPAPQARPTTPAPATATGLHRSPAWQVGNWWLFEVSESAAGDPADEDRLPTYRMLREVVDVEPQGETALLVTLRQHGGMFVDWRVVWRVSPTCVEMHGSGQKIHCTDPATVPVDVVGPLSPRGRRFDNPPFFTWFDDALGIVGGGTVVSEGGASTATLLGLSVGDRTGGQPRDEPVACALTPAGSGTSRWAAPDGSLALEVRETRTGATTSVTVIRTAGQARTEQTLEIPGASADQVSARLIPDGERCILRLRGTHGPGTRVADLDITTPEATRIRGTLGL